MWEFGYKFLRRRNVNYISTKKQNHFRVFRGGVYRTIKKCGEKYEEVTMEGRLHSSRAVSEKL
jgi:hypothetical protein